MLFALEIPHLENNNSNKKAQKSANAFLNQFSWQESTYVSENVLDFALIACLIFFKETNTLKKMLFFFSTENANK